MLSPDYDFNAVTVAGSAASADARSKDLGHLPGQQHQHVEHERKRPLPLVLESENLQLDLSRDRAKRGRRF